MIRYECDMCGRIFDCELDEYKMPRVYMFRENIESHGHTIASYSYNISTPISTGTHLCKDCAKKVAEMMKIIVDK